MSRWTRSSSPVPERWGIFWGRASFLDFTRPRSVLRITFNEQRITNNEQRATRDVPLPADRAQLGVPAGLKVERATAAIQETDKLISLVFSVGGREIGRTDAPRD